MSPSSRTARQRSRSYGGEFLPGGYDDWILELRDQLQRECVDLCTLVCEAQARQGDLAAAVSTARRRIALEPLEESGYRTLMELQADLGDRAGAVSTYHHCASVLERELGVIPDQATRNTLQRLLVPQQREDAPPIPLPADPGTGRLGLAATKLVGRTGELAVLELAWQAAAAGQPRVAVVRGGAGVGKTRLVSGGGRAGPAAGRRRRRRPVFRDVGTARAGPGRRLAAQPRGEVRAAATSTRSTAPRSNA